MMNEKLTSEEIKKELGRQLMTARLRRRSTARNRVNGKIRNQGMSRREMADILGLSPKTIQSWEDGRTFIDDLSLIPAIRNRLGIDVLKILRSVLAARKGKQP